MIDVNLIRTQVLLLHEAGPLVEAAVRQITAEAERHALECQKQALQEAPLFNIQTSPSIPPDHALVQGPDLVVTLIRNVRGILEPLRRNS